MSTNGPSEDGQAEPNSIEQVDQQALDPEFLSILQQLDQGTGETHNDITGLAGDEMHADGVPSFEQSWQESAGNATPETDLDANQASEEAPATIPMAEYVPEPTDESVSEPSDAGMPSEEEWRNLPDIDADGPVEWIDFKNAA